MPLLHASTTDDRGKTILLAWWLFIGVGPAANQKRQRLRAAATPTSWQDATALIPRATRRRMYVRMALGYLCILPISVLVFLIISSAHPLWTKLAMGVPCFLVLTFAPATITRLCVRPTLAPITRRHRLAAALCPACWYNLSGLRSEADGCRVCPECGAAWRLESVGPR